MKDKINNPETNKLISGLQISDVSNAVMNSGYPLQTIVVEKLKDFNITEEWSFIDRDTKEIRNIDILAEHDLFDYENHPDTRVRPHLSLLIECKQSIMPYIFFTSNNKPGLYDFPIYSGMLGNTSIKVKTDKSRDTWTFSINHLFGLIDHPFVQDGPDYSKVFSKCARKGKELELSGSDSYNSVIQPLIKSMIYYRKVTSPPKTAVYFDCYMTIGLAVIDAPMIGVKVNEGENELFFTPWVRVLRHEHDEEDSWIHKGKHFAIDIVHKDFLSSYLQDHLLPFSHEFGRLALKHAKVLVKGKGYIKGIENKHRKLEEYLEDV
ncbi:hypothetical protein ACFVVQ_18000 [Paenibacillus chitinolyticus]|uniref:hypothetical protein n=1 Tax=Paenibacillus chitinolyticus TaxID=79263 RepID=UPI0036DC3C11